jgi:SET domain-containing protein
MSPALEVREAAGRGRGLFAAQPIVAGAFIVEMRGEVVAEADLPDRGMAMQIGDDLWLFSEGDSLDDCGNHSCEPNSGFTTGEPALFALRDIAAGEEITWDYSTSIDCDDWSLECRCGARNCRGTIRPWRELSKADRERLTAIALRYLRNCP